MAESGPTDGARTLLLRLAMALGPLLLVVMCVRAYGLGFGPHHRVHEPRAQLHPALARELLADVSDVRDSRAAERVALSLTSDLLYFGFRHRTDLRFEQPRQANSVEYAELFGAAFNQLAAAAKLSARAQVVHSEPTSLLGFTPTHPALRSHDWVVIADGSQQRYVDPTLHDAWLGSDIARNVQGAVQRRRTAPRESPRPLAQPRPERIPSHSPHVSALRAGGSERGKSKAPEATRTRDALRMLEKIGVPLP
jgi:hypothetical protein